MAEELAQLWGKFFLTEEEVSGVKAIEDSLEAFVLKGHTCLVGKLLHNRIVGKDTIRKLLIKGWKPSGLVSFKVVGLNLFLVEFEFSWDLSRVLEGRPWDFEGNLFAVEEFDGLTPPSKLAFDTAEFWVRMYDLPLACMGTEMGFKLGAAVGRVVEVETNEEGVGWGEFLRVRIHVNLRKPLVRGRMLKVRDSTIWISFQYEKIPRFCFKCGVIFHGREGCMVRGSRKIHDKEVDDQFGPWLRVGSSNSWIDRRRDRGGGDYVESESRVPNWRRHGMHWPSNNRLSEGDFGKDPAGSSSKMVVGCATTGGEPVADIHAEVSSATVNVQIGLDKDIVKATRLPRELGKKISNRIQQGGSTLSVTENEFVEDLGGQINVGVCEGNNSLISGGSQSQRGDNIGNNIQTGEGCIVTVVASPKTLLGDRGPAESSNFEACSAEVGKSTGVGKENIDFGQQGGSVVFVSPKNRTWKKKTRGYGGITLGELQCTSVLGRRKAEELIPPEDQPKTKKRGRRVTAKGVLDEDKLVAVAVKPRQSP
jgi:hypothetical protein